MTHEGTDEQWKVVQYSVWAESAILRQTDGNPPFWSKEDVQHSCVDKALFSSPRLTSVFRWEGGHCIADILLALTRAHTAIQTTPLPSDFLKSGIFTWQLSGHTWTPLWDNLLRCRRSWNHIFKLGSLGDFWQNVPLTAAICIIDSISTSSSTWILNQSTKVTTLKSRKTGW